MPSSTLLLRDPAGQPVRLAGDDTITLSSEDADWQGLSVERQQLPPSAPEGFMPWHLLSVQLTPATLFEDFVGARVRRIRQRRGDVVFRPAALVTRAAWHGTADVINVALDPAVVGQVAAELLDGGAAELDQSYFGPDPRVWHLAHALMLQLEDPQPGGTMFVDSLRTALAAHLVSRYGQRAPRPARRGRTLSPRELDRVRDRVMAQLDGRLTVADLAAAVPLSRYHFSRVLKATTGLTPHQFVLRLRVGEAMRLLDRGVLDVSAVARRTGFADASHLARQFRRQVGTTPGRYAGRSGG